MRKVGWEKDRCSSSFHARHFLGFRGQPEPKGLQGPTTQPRHPHVTAASAMTPTHLGWEHALPRQILRSLQEEVSGSTLLGCPHPHSLSRLWSPCPLAAPTSQNALS